MKRQETLTRIKDLKSFIEKQDVKLTKFDETLSSQLIEKITVFDDHFTVEMKSGVSVDIKE